VQQCKAAGLEAVVCCFLPSYINPEHKRLAATIVREEYPEALFEVGGQAITQQRGYDRAPSSSWPLGPVRCTPTLWRAILISPRCSFRRALVSRPRRATRYWSARGGRTAQRRLLHSVDLRHQGQSHELSVAVPSGALTLAQLHEQFHAAHARSYGYDAREDAIELVNLRLTALGVSPKPRLPELPQGSPDPGEAQKGQRPVWFSETSGFTACPILDRAHLCWGNIVLGPAVIQGLDATTLVHPGYQAAVDQYGNLLLRQL
jgi:N-methylhydantoinase A/oxoprolinase/acetone carboxylase beta subunit